MFGSQIASYHNDVLTADPQDNEGKRGLVTEIKNRAKGSLSSKNYPEAIELYTKAIEVIPPEDSSEKSILYANRSMCHAGMGKFVEAENDAQLSIDLNNLYTKAYFRKTAALIGLGKFQEARSCVLTGLSQLPNDKDLLSQLSKIDAEIKKMNIPSNSNNSNIKTSNKTSSKPVKPEKSRENDEQPDEEEPNLNKETIRGYKKLPDGRVTTFFNNDLDERVSINDLNYIQF
jgi:tetratricopeptide (TPR) repeat protein